MLNLEDIKQNKLKLVFEKQGLHLILLIILLIIFFMLSGITGSLSGSFANISTETWYIIALTTPILHQIYVWIFWRLQLYYNFINNILGRYGFPLYAIGFFILFFLRFLTILVLSLSNRGTLIDYQILLWLIAIIITFPVIYVLYSIKTYFGALRATGADHFDVSYHSLPLVKKGIFKYTNNAMYWLGLLVFWIPGLIFTSLGALEIALFTHIYIWIHYFTVEKPDMKKIYGND